MSGSSALSEGSRQNDWSILSPGIIAGITCFLPWTDLGSLRRLNKHWCKSVNLSIRTAKFSSVSSIPTDLLLKFSCLENLSFDNINDMAMNGIKAIQKIPSLKALKVKGMKIGNDSLKAISSCKNIKELGLFDLILPRNGLEGLNALSQLVQLTVLKMVYIDMERVEYAGNHCVEMISHLVNLKQLELRFDMTSAVLHKLSTLNSLESLYISSITLHIPDLQFLKPLRQLKQLSLPWTHFSSYKGEDLDTLINLTSLDLGATDVTDDSVQDFSRLTKLRHLILKDNCITNTTLNHLSTLTDLISLDVSHGAGLSDVCSLGNVSELRALRSLNVNGTHIGDSDMMHLCHLSNLERLDIGLTDATDVGVHHLSVITSLKEINTEIVRNHFDPF